MTKRSRDEVILARWTVDPASLREFTSRVRARYTYFPPQDLLKACDRAPTSGLEVVCREDEIFVGRWCLSFIYNNVSAIRLEEEWVLFELDGGACEIPVPVGPSGRPEAARIIEYYLRKWREEGRQAMLARQAPTWNNRLLDLAEAHPAWVMLGFFFVVIPLIVVIVGLLRGEFE